MVIALDGIPLTTPKTGIGHYTFELARAVAQQMPEAEFELVSPSNLPPIKLDEVTPANLHSASVRVGLISRRWWSVGLPRFIKRRGIELFHGTNYEIPVWGNCATVVTVHDLSLLVLRDKQGRRQTARARVRLPVMAGKADVVIVPSRAVKDEVCDRLQLAQTKVFVIPEAARDFFKPATGDEIESVKERFAISGPFLFTVGTIEPRKNYLTLIEAFEGLLRARPDIGLQLVIAGAPGWRSEEVMRRIESSFARPRILLVGYLADTDLRALYSGCLVSVYQSEYEGFGLPLLEAMACGAPVVTSNIESIHETVGDAARLVDPFDVHGWTKNLHELIEDEKAREELRVAGFGRASEFSWKSAAEKTIEVYKEALNRRRKREVSTQLS